jgi:hypothetical protein
VGPFEFIITFFSFVYTLGLTHLLLAAVQMIRRRREIVFSWPHAFWMIAAALLLAGNWISLWDFRRFPTISLATIAVGFVFSVLVYCICALVSPDFERGDTLDMRDFHEREGRTYMGFAGVAVVLSIVLNFAAGAAMGVQNWANQNGLVLAMVPCVFAPLFLRWRWVQFGGPLLLSVLMAAYLVLYYPALTKG